MIDQGVVSAGDKDILIMANHGVISVASTVSMAVENLYFLERAAKVQVRPDDTRQVKWSVKDINSSLDQCNGHRASSITIFPRYECPLLE